LFFLCVLCFSSVSSVVCFICEKIITRVNGEKKSKRRRTMTTGKKQIKISGFFSVPSVFLCVLCGSFPFMLKTYHRGNGEKKSKRRRTMTTGKKQIKISGFSLCPLFSSVSSVVGFQEKFTTEVTEKRRENGENQLDRSRLMPSLSKTTLKLINKPACFFANFK